jgi:hypothetical protein
MLAAAPRKREVVEARNLFPSVHHHHLQDPHPLDLQDLHPRHLNMEGLGCMVATILHMILIRDLATRELFFFFSRFSF